MISNIDLRKNNDKEILRKLNRTSHKITSINDTYPIIYLNSGEDLNNLNLDQEKICLSIDKDNIFLYRLKDSFLYCFSNELIPLFKDIEVYIISYNIKEVIKYFYSFDTEIKYCWDCYIASRIIDENISDTSLANLYKLYINEGDSQDIIKIYKLYKLQEKYFIENSLELCDLYYNIELPCVRIVANMELNGIRVDEEYLNDLINKYSSEKKYYLENLKRYVTKDSIIHSNINQYAAVTGRMSISNPSLQNIPNNKEVRDLFIPREGNIFISSDYSQQEIRILTELCKDPKMLEIFNSGKDIYSELASLIFDLSYEECLNSNIRNKTKQILLSIIYGVGYNSLAKELGCSIEEVKEIKNKILNIFRYIPEFENKTIEEVIKNKYIQTEFGRRRRFHDLITNREYRQAINSKVQGTGADILKLVLVKLYYNKELKDLGIKLIIPIHDEILFECPIENRYLARDSIKNIMENISLQIPMKCDIKFLKRWGTPYVEGE